MAVTVLREKDPKFELPPEKRCAAQIYGKTLKYSDALRKGLAETLALLGSHSEALTSCSFGKAEETVILAVRESLKGGDWVQWASLNDLLPLLAEAAPKEFIIAVENALASHPCPFDELFAQEGSGITGSNYMTGLLWALETLAWDAEFLGPVIALLGELAARDPGGNWANRPINSLTTILLPWRPQTCGTIVKRRAAVATLLDELPSVAWRLLISLLPKSQSASPGSRKPAWRVIIPDDWSERVSGDQYWEQVTLYAELAMRAAKTDLAKLAELIDRVEDLPPPAHDQFLAHLESDSILTMSEADRFVIWSKLMDLAAKHKRFAGANWAMWPEQVEKIVAIAERLEPNTFNFGYRRLFSERDSGLYEEKVDYERQRHELDKRRRKAVEEIFAAGGIKAMVEFAEAVESPWRVGLASGVVAASHADQAVLPELLESEIKPLTQFAGGFVWGRFRSQGWQWVEALDSSRWTPTQIGQLLAYLPFTSKTWELSAKLLEQDDSPYWTKTTANPYEAENDLTLGRRKVDQPR